MDLSKVKLNSYKYKIKKFQLTINKETKHEVPVNLTMKFNIVEDYEQFCFPYFEIDFGVPNNIYRLMSKNQDKIKVNLSIYAARFEKAIDSTHAKPKSLLKAISGTFFAFMSDTTPDLTEDEQQKIEKSENKFGQLSMVKILLYPYNYYQIYKNVTNIPLLNVTLVDALVYLLNKNKVKNVLLSPPANCKKYKQFILTPIPFKDQVDRICNTYHMHKKGTLYYFGLDRFYIIDKQPACTAYSTNEPKIVYVTVDTKSKDTRLIGGSYANKVDQYIVLNTADYKINNNSEKLNKVVGENIVSVDSSGNIAQTNKKAKKITKVITQDDGENDVDSINRSISESKRVFNASFKNEDITALTPNKQFVVTMPGGKYKKYNGKYRLCKLAHMFEKEGEYFQVSTTAEFRG